jgi:hypothetical protein
MRQKNVTMPKWVEHLRGTEGPVDLQNVASSAELDEESQPFRADFEAFEVICVR